MYCLYFFAYCIHSALPWHATAITITLYYNDTSSSIMAVYSDNCSHAEEKYIRPTHSSFLLQPTVFYVCVFVKKSCQFLHIY